METFQIRVSSLTSYIITFLTIIFVGIAAAVVLLPTKGNSPLAIAVVIVVIGGAFYLAGRTSRAMIQWEFTDAELRLKWLSQFFFQSKPDLTINWSDIQEYKYRPDQYFDLFKIKLNDGRSIKLRHDSIVTRDDFQKFLAAFEAKVKKQNEKDEDASHHIKQSKVIYETKLGLALAILTALCLIAIPILAAVLPNKRHNWAGLIAACSGGIFFISQVLIYRRKKSSS